MFTRMILPLSYLTIHILATDDHQQQFDIRPGLSVCSDERLSRMVPPRVEDCNAAVSGMPKFHYDWRFVLPATFRHRTCSIRIELKGDTISVKDYPWPRAV
jgi:hypothetical protein